MLFWDVTQRRVVASCGRFGTKYRVPSSRVKKFFWGADRLYRNVGMTTSVRCVTSQKSGYHLYRGGTMKSCKHPQIIFFFFYLAAYNLIAVVWDLSSWNSFVPREELWLYVTCLSGVFKLLKPNTYSTYRQLLHSEIVCSAHTMYLCVLCGSENKQRLFPYTALTDWFV